LTSKRIIDLFDTYITNRDDPLYETTRRFVLSPDNPFFFQGSAGT